MAEAARPSRVTRRAGPATSPRIDPEFPLRGPTRPRPRHGDADDGPASPSLADLLGELAEGRARPRHTIEEPPTVVPPPAVSAALPVVGCFFRLLLLIVVFVLLVLAGLFMLFNGGLG
jgi:hypothetical protein